MTLKGYLQFPAQHTVKSVMMIQKLFFLKKQGIQGSTYLRTLYMGRLKDQAGPKDLSHMFPREFFGSPSADIQNSKSGTKSQ